MDKALSIPEPMLPSEQYNQEQVALIKSTVAKGLTDIQFMQFCYVAKAVGLDPLRRQIHAIVRKNKKGGTDLCIQTGIDGYRAIAHRTHEYAGKDDATFISPSKGRYPETATVTVYRVVRGVRVPFTATVRWDEYFPKNEKEQFMWKKMPYGQLEKCAEAKALRAGFPEETGGIYIDDEMHQAGIIDITPVKEPERISKASQDAPEDDPTPEQDTVVDAVQKDLYEEPPSDVPYTPDPPLPGAVQDEPMPGADLLPGEKPFKDLCALWERLEGAGFKASQFWPPVTRYEPPDGDVWEAANQEMAERKHNELLKNIGANRAAQHWLNTARKLFPEHSR